MDKIHLQLCNYKSGGTLMATTRWVDKETLSLEDAIRLLCDNVEDDSEDLTICRKNWNLTKVFQNNETVRLSGRTIMYNVIKYSYEQVTVVPPPGENRIIPKSGIIITYDSGAAINYIVDQNSQAQKMLRKLLSYTGKNELQKNTFEFSHDFFVWLISRVYNRSCTIENTADETLTLQLDAIKGVKGDTEDLQTKVSADGEAVMNVISTLSFLLESGKLNQIKLDLNYTNHETISLILQQSTIGADCKHYQGIFEKDGDDRCVAKLYLLIYLEILPILEQEYQTEILEKTWNQAAHIQFMNSVAGTLNEKIQVKISSLNNE